MISVFRKLRKKMSDDSKPLKYLRYAVGEIMLIVIGILIALQINTYKNRQNDRQIELNVLSKLKVDLIKDTLDLNKLLQIKKDQYVASQNVLGYFRGKGRTVQDTLQVRKNIFNPLYDYVNHPYKAAFTTASNSGNLFKITNDSLLTMVTSYYDNNNLTQYLLSTKSYTENFRNILLMNYNLGNLSIIKFLNDFQMENYYHMMIIRLDIGVGLIEGEITTAKNLIALIDNEIKEKK